MRNCMTLDKVLKCSMPYYTLHGEAGITIVSDSRIVVLRTDNMLLNHNARHIVSIQQKSVIAFFITDYIIVRKMLCLSGSMLPHLQASHASNTD